MPEEGKGEDDFMKFLNNMAKDMLSEDPSK